MEVMTYEMRRERWKEIINECSESGMKKRDWLADHHINPKTYYRCQRKLRMENGAELVPVRNNSVAPVQEINDFCPLEKPAVTEKTGAVISAGGLNITIGEDISDEFLMRILRAASHV